MLDEVLRTLEAVKKAGDGWVARCPAHEDATASLSVKDKGPDAWPLFHCFTGCTFEDVRAALEAKGLKREQEDRTPPPPRTIRDRTPYQVFGLDGVLLCRHVRLEWSDGGKTFAWEMPNGKRKLEGLKSEDLLFGAEQIRALPPGHPIILVEGEKAALALRSWGAAAAVGTVCGASATPSLTALEAFRGRPVYLWPDADKLGLDHMERTAARLEGIATRVRMISWREAPQKGDAADWLINAREREDLSALLHQAEDSGAPGPPSLWPDHVVPIFEPELVKSTLRDMEDYGTGTRAGVVPTGFSKLDRMIRGGFEPGEVYLLGAPTGGGKTTIMQCMGSAAAKAGPVLLVTPEMTLQSIARRELLRRAQVRERNLSKFAEASARDDAWAEIVKAGAGILENKPPLLLLDQADASMDDVEQAADGIEGLRMILIDYAQQVASLDDRVARYLQVGEVAHRSIALAQRLRIPVVLASQVNVTKGKGAQKDERFYSFRESQVLEQKAGVVLIFDTDQEDDQSNRDAVECHFACRKNRHGPGFWKVPALWWKWFYLVGEPPEQVRVPTLADPASVREPYAAEQDDD